ncbi:FadR/GntR family transcriptional regulator [uncultured Modestobacter sp.]|uniref:FadR/GntR family transcriptional regulator n=1 Tax=uncultured Modestobacter sp. TaxID=380048 RepID=UPI00261E5AD4|nr:FCD domain-containing protein [uncultured Modestobacter sp.]
MPLIDVDPSRDASAPGSQAHSAPDEPAAGKLAAQVALRIERDIVGRGWPVGESLGSQSELRQRYGVSRAVLREAVRLVEHHHVARMRRGPGGGLFVVAPDARPAARAIVIYLESVNTSVDDLMEARRLIEPLAAAMAAAQVTEDGITELRHTLAAGSATTDDRGDRTVEALHVLLGELSANPVLGLFIEVLTRLTDRYGRLATDTPASAFREARAEAHRRHAEIADLVIAGDAGRAETRMAAYLDAVAAWMRSHGQGGRVTDRVATSPLTAAPQAKLAEVVAGRLRDDIAAAGRPVGAVIGSESDLLSRYGISRAVLREAVRLLEYHSVASMRRGPGGGLVVGTPDAQASVETMALYLEYRAVGPRDLLAVREVIELGVVTRVTARHDDPEVVRRLDVAARWPEPESARDRAPADSFHAELAELAGNPVLTLFLRILTALWRRHAPVEGVVSGSVAATEVERVHRRIAEAVLAGDEGLARHRLRRHLAALTDWWH